jgi:hypothetical protein
VQVPAEHPSAVGCGRDGDAAVQRSGGQVSLLANTHPASFVEITATVDAQIRLNVVCFLCPWIKYFF